MGWAGIKNGDLMKLAEADFDVFITVDRNLSYQQNLPRFNIALIVLRAVSNRYDDLKPISEKVLESLQNIAPGRLTVISL